MSFLGNVAWLLTGGIITWFAWLILGIVLCVFIVTIPFGLQCFKIAGLAFSPFGKTVVNSTEAVGCTSTLGNIIWACTIGICLFLSELVIAIVLTIFIVTFPFAKQHMKLGVLGFAPFGKAIR